MHTENKVYNSETTKAFSSIHKNKTINKTDEECTSIERTRFDTTKYPTNNPTNIPTMEPTINRTL